MSLVRIHHDKETYSETDLTKIGVHRYSLHPSTDCLLTSGLVEGERHIRRWRPGDPYPYRDIHPDDTEIQAWNSQFERWLWWNVMVPRYGWPKLELEQFVCVSAQARAMGAGPAKLDIAGPFFRSERRKDNKGHLHMLKMCRPADDRAQLVHGHAIGRDPGKYDLSRCHHTPAAIDRLHDYCDDDVWTEYDIAQILPEWTMSQLEDFWESERINDHGMVVDVDFARAATAYAEDEKAFFSDQIAQITNGVVTTPRQFQRIKDWLRPQLGPAAIDICERYDDGVKKFSLDADTRANLLAEHSADPEFLDDEIVEFIELLDMAGKSTIAKYQAIVDRAETGLTDDNARVHGLYMFAGAAQSGRYSSTGIQVHNLVRDVPKEAVSHIRAFKRGDDKAVRAFGEPVHLLSKLVRPTITGCLNDEFDLAWCDWSSIEARMLPWLACDPRADDRLALFRRGEDVYLVTASAICGRKITKADEFERQAFGKVPELSLGYGGWVGAFKAMAKNYGVKLPERQIIEIASTWRKANPWCSDNESGFWVRLEQAAMQAIRKPGSSFNAGRVGYRYDEDALGGMGALFAILPSGREIPYPDARIDVQRRNGRDELVITAAKGAWRPKKGEDEWPRVGVWKGLLAENATQAACADLLRIALRRSRKAGLLVCSHTHDEIMIETPKPERDALRLKAIMLTRPGWPGDDALPLHADEASGYRYKVKFPEPEKVAA